MNVTNADGHLYAFDDTCAHLACSLAKGHLAGTVVTCACHGSQFGPALLGVRAVIAESFERIHRSNLVGMGILPLEFRVGASVASLGVTGDESFFIRRIGDGLAPGAVVADRSSSRDGR